MRLYIKTLLLLSIVQLQPTAGTAAVIYSGLQNIIITTGNFDGVYIDVENLNPLTNNSTSPFSGWDVNFFMGGIGEYNSAAFQPVRASGSDHFSLIQNVPFGTLVSSSSIFASGIGGSDTDHIGSGPGKFTAGEPGYLAFRLAGNSGPLYGWMRVTLTQDDPGALVHDWAYDDSGASILVGQTVIPEPGKTLLLMLGATGLLMQRRRSRR
ncbi:MAG: PEP-CTERM sorting domain-containing protein [Verrucomicrobia bacterium]|nr:PEP-CTERM sorting domain-containing protein [Verrucomicrobiota bacterium]